MHIEYTKAGGKVACPTFVKLWSKECADVNIMQPKEDVCGTCSDLHSKITRARTEETRLQCTEALCGHINLAANARDVYSGAIQRAKVSLAVASSRGCTPSYEHSTFDFAQQATIPHHARGVALYFKVPRRIQIFGVATEALPKQVNYLFDEHQSIGPDGSKSYGPSAVVSMPHDFLAHSALCAMNIGLHADNCRGQNKN